MRILHLSHTPLVGAPGRICRALNLHPGIDARWAVLDSQVGNYSSMAFDMDLDWNQNRDEVVAIAETADVIHLHNYLGLTSQDFAPLDFSAMRNQGRAIVRQFHSTPSFIARYLKTDVAEVLGCPLPKLVIAQFQERYYPSARLVPNIVFPDDHNTPTLELDERLRIGFAPSRFNSARSSRWDTKGYPETRRLLFRLARTMQSLGRKVEIDIIEQVSHAECLSRKAKCHIFLDDLVTGSYHLNTLESLAMGATTLTYLDSRTQSAVYDLTGRIDFPAINTGLENAHDVLVDLASNPVIALEVGRRSKAWMEMHWNPGNLALHFLNAYREVVSNPTGGFPPRFNNNAVDTWLVERKHDLEWESRTRYWPKPMPDWAISIKSMGGAALRRAGLKT